MCACLLVLLCGCGDDAAPAGGKFAVKIGETLTLTAPGENVGWMSGDPDIATVTGGIVAGVSEGKTTVTATDGEGNVTTFEVTVENAYVPVVSILNKASTLYLGNTYKLRVAVTVGDETSDAKVAWKSSNEGVATVSEDGTVTTVSGGKVTITASATVDGDYTEDSFEAVVAKLNYIDAPARVDMGLYAGDRTATLSYKIYLDSAATNEKATLTSADPGVVTVNAAGRLTAVAEGETYITVSYSSDKDNLTVKVPVRVSRHRLFTYNSGNTLFYSGDLPRTNGITKGTHWTNDVGKIADEGTISGRGAVYVQNFSNHYKPGLSWKLELTKAELQRYLKAGYSKVVVPFYTDHPKAVGLQFQCADFITEALPTGKWLEMEFPLDKFIAYYDSYAVEGTPILLITSNPLDYYLENGKGIGYNMYFGDIYLR